MSRKKRFVKDLNTVDIAALEAGKKQGKSEVFRNRCHAILLSNRGYTVEQIMDIFGVARNTVYTWFNRWEKGGFEALKTKSGQGRKPIICANNAAHVEGVKKAVKKVAKEGGNLIAEIQSELEIEEDLTKKMLSLFLQKLITPGNAFVKG